MKKDTEAPLGPAELVEAAGRRAREAARVVASLPTGVKNDALRDLADGLLIDADEILAANDREVRIAERRRVPAPIVDRMALTRQRLGAMANRVREVAAHGDPVGEVLRGSRRPNGLVVQEVRVPLGVVGILYEDLPNVTVDASSLALKAGNAILLFGGEATLESNRVILATIRRALERNGIPDAAVQLIDTADPAAEERFIHLKEGIDVLIPRGSPEFIRRVCGSASVATIETGIGCCHVFVERSARLDMAADIAFNAKVQRPGVTNSLDTLLVDAPVASQFLPLIGPRLAAFGVEIRGCERTREALPQARPATPADHGVAFLSLVLAVRVVDGLDIAIAHINQYGGHNSEAIVTQDYFAARRFCERVDAGAVYVNASTRFTDGYEFGLGSELGISTQKLHRRGPLGLRSLTTWKWVIYGDGQVRD